MRKTIITLFLLGLSLIAAAGPVSRDRALNVARQMFEAQGPATKASGDGNQLDVLIEDDIYVIGRRGGGFVIVSGNDAASPILGFSFENHFKTEGMPEHVRWWMDHLRRVSRSATQASAETMRRWDAFDPTKSKPNQNQVTNIFSANHTVQWNQTDPANLLCPVAPGESQRSVCGCLPLAISEVMVWFGYPEKGNGTLPSYNSGDWWTGYWTVDGYELDYYYNWAAMQACDTPGKFYNAQEPAKSSIAHLVHDVGVMIKASYSYYGTGAYSEDVIAPMAKYMGYNNSARLEYASRYSDAAWNNMLTAEVEKHPLVFCGYSVGSTGADAGHAYVLDGYGDYNGTRVFHFNLGWGGDCSGYYYGKSQDVGDYNFDDDLEAFFDLVPATPDSFDYPEATLGFYEGYNSETKQTEGGVRITSASGSSRNVSLFNIRNLGATPFDGKVYLQWVGKDGKQKDLLFMKDFSDTPIQPGYSTARIQQTISLGGGLELGDRLVPLFSRDGSADGGEAFIAAENGSILTSAPLVDATFIDTQSSYYAGDTFEFKLKNCGYRYNDATWYFTSPSGNVSTYKQSSGKVKLGASGRYLVRVVTSQESITTYITVK